MALADKGEILIQFTDHTRKFGYIGNVPRCFGASQEAQVVKNSPANTRDVDSTPGSGRSPGGGHGNPLQIFLPGNSHGQSSLVGYRPLGHKESDVTEAT